MWNEVIHNIDRCIWTKINAYDKNMRWQQIWARDKLRQNLQRKLAQLSMTIFSKFWSRDHYPICIHGSRSRCFTCIAEQVTSEVVDMFSRGGRDCHFANTSVEMAKFVRAAVQLLRQCFINSWIQTALFLIIAIVATSAAVSWQFAGWISPIPPRLYSTAVNKVWCLQCGQMF